MTYCLLLAVVLLTPPGGTFSVNRFDPESIANPYGPSGTPYGNTVTNPYGPYGGQFAPESPDNPFGVDLPDVRMPEFGD